MNFRGTIKFFVFFVIVGHSQTAKADTVDNFQVYIGQKLILTEKSFNPLSSKLASLALDSTNYRDTIVINFNHCTAGASHRIVMLKDIEGNVIRKWSFPDKELIDAMKIPILDIYDNVDDKLKDFLSLHYYDNQLSLSGILIAAVSLDDLSIIKKKPTKKIIENYIIFWAGGLVVVAIVALFIKRRRSATRRS